LDDVEKVVKDICSCKYTISSSLHGIIVSHAYNIKSLWYKLSDLELSGDNIKFEDYFTSVNIENYLPYELWNIKELNIDEIVKNIEKETRKNSIQADLNKIQLGLLLVAPFPIIETNIINRWIIQPK
jgi:hypothetical protein